MSDNSEVLQRLLETDLYNAGWDPLSEETTRQKAMTSLSVSLLKKFHNDQRDEIRDSAAGTLFLECNERCRNFDGVRPRNELEATVLGETKSLLYDFFFPTPLEQVRSYAAAKRRERRETSYVRGIADKPFPSKEEIKRFACSLTTAPVKRTVFDLQYDECLLNLSSIAKYFGLGGGTNIGAKSTNFYTKYVNSTMACTDLSLHKLFMQAISSDDLWADIEMYRLTTFGTEVVRGSRLSYVPKNRKISRTICTEPLLNMIFQKGIGGVLQQRLLDVFGIDLSTQPARNSRLAHIGSYTQGFGTIDLSSASDTISLRLIRELLPSQPVSWLLRARSPVTVFPNGDEVELHMISSMGNGFTFPLQTLIFAALVRSVYKVLDIKITHNKTLDVDNYAVFGDDIIVVSEAYDLVCDMLSLFGFSVNKDKSFNKGHFRESCGKDYFLGHNVRGVYIQTLLSDGDLYSAINRLNRWSAEHGIYLPNTVSYLLGGCRFRGVPFSEADDAGIKIPASLLRTYSRDANGAIKYLALVNVSSSVRIPSVEPGGTINPKVVEKLRRKLRSFDYHSEGLLFCLLAGYLRAGKLGIRDERPRAVQKRRVCPGWDKLDVAGGPMVPFSFSDWEVAVGFNLEG